MLPHVRERAETGVTTLYEKMQEINKCSELDGNRVKNCMR